MADVPEQPTPSRGRRAVRTLAAVALVLVVLVGGCIWFWEYFAYNEDISSCYSDNMSALKEELADYCREHDGQMPATFDELRAYVKEKKGGTYDVCVRADAPFIWMPEGVQTDESCSEGTAVVLMCPPGSHGWLRKYAFGLAHGDNGTFYFVRVRKGRATRFRP